MSLLYGGSSGEANHHLFHLIFRKVNDNCPLRVLVLLHSVQTSMEHDRFYGMRSNGDLTFVYFCQLWETAWTYALYFLTFTEVAGFEIMLKLNYLRVPTSLLTVCDTNIALDSGLSLGAWKVKLTTPDRKKQSVKGRNPLNEISLTKVFKLVRKRELNKVK